MKNLQLGDLRHYAPRPGDADLEACDAAARELAEIIAPLIRKSADLSAADRLRDARRRARALALFGRNFTINRRKLRKGDHALRPLYAIWTMLNQCNFRCTYCDNHQGHAYYDVDDPGRLDTVGGKRLLELIHSGTPALYWCGGEPTLRDDLPELLDYSWDLGFFPNMINTNGFNIHQRLQQRAWRDFLWQMDVVVVSLDALNQRLLRKLWGVSKTEQVLVNLLLLRRLRELVKFKLSVNTVISEQTLDEARAVLDLCADLDLWFVPVPVNQGHRPSESLLQNPDYQALAELILQRKADGQKIIGSATLLGRLLYCRPHTCYTTLKPHIWSDGSLCWPCRAPVNVEPQDINLLKFDSFDQAYAAGRKLVNPDNFHGPAANQCGGECAWMQNYTTSRYAEGLLHPLQSGIVGEIAEFALNPAKW
ncbi:MAG: radical SAM protein [Candidatus Alcyoniella australis]|nr:radical SAM protein [Candidatus Alcyoniella australis]